MIIRKSDYALYLEAERSGYLGNMEAFFKKEGVDLTKRLSKYFSKKMAGYSGVFDEEESEEILYRLNKYIEGKGGKEIQYPLGGGTDIHIVEVTDNIKLVVSVSDEYFGYGESEVGLFMNRFIVDEAGVEEDVDKLVDFISNIVS